MASCWTGSREPGSVALLQRHPLGPAGILRPTLARSAYPTTLGLRGPWRIPVELYHLSTTDFGTLFPTL